MILCCGEALIDMVPITSEDGKEGFAPLPGGAIFNTAIALGRLDQKPGFFSGLSKDLFGDVLRESLDGAGVDASLSRISARPTTLAFVRLNNGHATYTFYDENTAGRMLDKSDLPEIPQSVSALYFGGISLCAEPAADAYAELAARERGSRVIMLDPNIRPGFITDEPRYRARLSAMIAASDIVKVSDEDLDWIMPGPESLEDKMKALIGQGPVMVVVTRGSEGAIAMLENGQSVTCPARKVEVRDTVGAGDTFNAGLLASLADQGLLSRDALSSIASDAIKSALDLGARVAAVTVSRDGANPPWLHELD